MSQQEDAYITKTRAQRLKKQDGCAVNTSQASTSNVPISQASTVVDGQEFPDSTIPACV